MTEKESHRSLVQQIMQQIAEEIAVEHFPGYPAPTVTVDMTSPSPVVVDMIHKASMITVVEGTITRATPPSPVPTDGPPASSSPAP